MLTAQIAVTTKGMCDAKLVEVCGANNPRRLIAATLNSLMALLAAASGWSAVPETPKVLWTRAADAVPWIALDSSGNLFCADTSLRKFDPSGNVLWWISVLPPVGSMRVQADRAGSAIVAGPVVPSGVSIGSTNLPGSTLPSFFLAKFSADGQFISARSGGGGVYYESLNLDADGNCFVGGFLAASNADFCGVPIADVPNRPFLAKFQADGTFEWVRNFGSSLYGYGTHVAADADGNAYVAGTLQGTGLFDGTNLTSLTSANLYVAKFDAAGNLRWIKQANGVAPAVSLAWRIVVDGAGNSYVAGIFAGPSISFDGIVLTSEARGAFPDRYDMFLAKFDPSGRALWATKAGGLGDDWPGGLVLFGSNVVAMSGSFSGSSATFDDQTITNHCRSDYNDCSASDGFVAGYSTDAGILQTLSIIGDTIADERIGPPVVDLAGHYCVPIIGSIQPGMDYSVAKLATAEPPSLAVRRETNGVLLAWSALYPEFLLESSTNAAAPGSWLTNDFKPVVSNGTNSLILPASESKRFFRLSAP